MIRETAQIRNTVQGTMEDTAQDTVLLPDGTSMPRFGMGTWHLAEGRRPQSQELNALRAGLDAGITLIDTAEMYADGKAESLVGRAIKNHDRSRLFLVSKVYPHNAGRRHLRQSLEASLSRLGTDYLDMYLLHWRGSIPLSETVECMEQAKSDGLIRNWGVSNFDTADMQELFATDGGDACAVNQDLYHLGSRGVEYDLLPWMDAHRMPMMAYCPLAQAGTLRSGLTSSPVVRSIAAAHDADPIQILLAFVLRRDDMIAIPCTGSAEHLRSNLRARSITFSDDEITALDRAFPAPTEKEPLDMQ
ncbi:aldo/keto reductase [Bifidobacterium margollesii]|uniref:Aldo/keto reductase n=1 Tax=Bifidobacterium margollesii TaxID=2020964 RepID=A0A2N5JAZ1_9BIFI|nr:aldo/keto reductase [Bifidobacterium margollesii]PLS31379.1 aldo/keto reductase [Bifidobacterium margollesii]